MQHKIKLVATLITVIAAVTTITGCSIKNNTTTESYIPFTTVTATTETVDSHNTATYETEDILSTTTVNTEQFQKIYDEYIETLRSKTPVLIEEFKSESIYNAENGLDNESLAHDKESQLTLIFNEGLAEFVKIVNSNNASPDEYNYWEGKLNAVYNEQVEELNKNCISSYGEDYDY